MAPRILRNHTASHAFREVIHLRAVTAVVQAVAAHCDQLHLQLLTLPTQRTQPTLPLLQLSLQFLVALHQESSLGFYDMAELIGRADL